MHLPLQTRFAIDPAGTLWRISIRWLPWTPRARIGTTTTIDVASVVGSTADAGLGCLVVALPIALVLLALPLLVLVVELVVFLAVFTVVVLGFGVLGLRRWTIEVEGIAVHRVGDDAADLLVVRRALSKDRGVLAADRTMAGIAASIERGEFDPSADQLG